MDPQQQFCLKWNSYSSNLAMTFSNLFKSELLADVTLFCGGTVFKAHKLILAACSKNFAELFETAPTGNGSSCVVILEATSAENMSALLEFMYKGEVHVSQEALNSFLKAAENLQVKGLSTEHGRLAAAQSQSHDNQIQSSVNRRQQRNSLSAAASPSGSHAAGSGLNSLKQECDSLMHPSSSGLGTFSSYLPPIYRPMVFDQSRKRLLRSPLIDQETSRQSVLRDGSKGSAESPSPGNKKYRPGSSASSTAPTEADTMQAERASPQSSRYENHSPPSTTDGTGTPTGHERNELNDRSSSGGGGGNAGGANETLESKENINMLDMGAQDLRVKMENEYIQQQPPTSNSALTTPTSLSFIDKNNESGGIPGGLVASIAPADMLNVWNATKLNNKGGTVNTADGKKLKCLYCERLYGYETNLRAHIRQRHQGIRVPCPYCTRTFTRNNTVRRHIAREHKPEIGLELQPTAATASGQNHTP